MNALAEKQDEMIMGVEISRLRTFSNHPFKIQYDSQMIELRIALQNMVFLIR